MTIGGDDIGSDHVDKYNPSNGQAIHHKTCNEVTSA